MTFIQAAHHSSGSNLPPTRVVIHATCPELGFPKASSKGRAVSTARYFQSASSGGSAHYVVDIGETVQCLAENVIAWHAPPNSRSLGIEICADGGSASSFKNPKVRYTRAQWLSSEAWPAVLRAAALTRQMCQKYGIPMVKLTPADLKAGKKGICGHVDVSNAFRQSDHDDPGPDFPWDQFMAVVNGTAAPTTEELTVSQYDDIMRTLKNMDEKIDKTYSAAGEGRASSIRAERKIDALPHSLLTAIRWGKPENNLARLLTRLSAYLGREGVDWGFDRKDE